MHRPLAVLTLALASTTCGGAAAPSPTAPSATRPADQGFTVAGTVTAQGNAPVEGAKVFVAGKQGMTNRNGRYELSGVPSSHGGASAVKEGYAASRQVVTVSADTQLDFQLGPAVAIYTLSGIVSEQTTSGTVVLPDVLIDVYSCEQLSASPPFFSNACPVIVHRSATTDRHGAFTVAGLYGGDANDISVSKEGFFDPLAMAGDAERPNASHTPSRRVAIDGATRYDIQLVRR